MKRFLLNFSLIRVYTLCILLLSLVATEWTTAPFNPDDHENVVVLLGATFPFSGGWAVGHQVQPGMDLALEEINSNNELLRGVTAVGIWGDSKCLASHGLSKFVSLVKERKVQAIIGDGCSVACEPMASLGGVWQVPQISWGCSSPILSDKSRFPYFIRTAMHENMKIDFVVKLFKHYGWRRYASITADIPLTSSFMDQMATKAKEENIEVVLSEVHKLDEIPKLQMERIKERGVTIILVGGYANDIRNLMLLATELDMAGEGYSYISFGGGFISPEWWVDTKFPPDGKDEIAKNAGQGHFAMLDHPGSGPATDKFQETYSAITNTPISELNPFSGQVYDSLFIASKAITELISGEGQWKLRPLKDEEKSLSMYGNLKWTVGLNTEKNEPKLPQLDENAQVLEVNGTELLWKMQSQSFVGASGPLSFDSDGDRLPVLNLLNVRDNALVPVMTWSHATGIFIDPEYHLPIKFGGNVDKPPLDFLQRETIYISLGLRIVVIVLTGIAQLLTCTILYMILYLRNNVIIRASSVNFCVIMLLSALALLSVLYLLAVPNLTDGICQARQFVGHCAFCSLFSAMLAKTWRVQRLMGATRTLKKVTIKDQELFRVVIGVSVIVITLLIIWIVQDGPMSVFVYDQDSRTKYAVCSASTPEWFTRMIEESGPDVDTSIFVGSADETPITSPYLYALFIVEAILLLWSVQLSIQTRNVADAFNESRPLALTTFLIAFLVILIGPMQIYLVGSQDLHLLQFSFGALIGITFCVVVLFVPKITAALANPKATMQDITNKSLKTTHRTSMKQNKSTNSSFRSGTLSREPTSTESASRCSKCMLGLFSRLQLGPNTANENQCTSNESDPQSKSDGKRIPEGIRNALNIREEFISCSPECVCCEQNVVLIEKLTNHIQKVSYRNSAQAKQGENAA